MTGGPSGDGDRPDGTVAVLGLGLIGGSLALRLHRAGRRVVAWNRGEANRVAAAAAGLDVTEHAAAAVRSADLVVLAVPLPALPGLLEIVAGTGRPDAVVTDVTSVKGQVRDLVLDVAPSLRFVGGHPMAGTEHSGFDAADPALFEDAVWVVCRDERTDAAAWDVVADVAGLAGAQVVDTDPDTHDDAVARISHVPHVLAASLAASAAEAGDLTLSLGAGSFRDGTRVAGTRPALSTAMCLGNREAALRALDDVTARLGVMRAALESGAEPDLLRLFEDGFEGRQRWERLRGAG